MNDWFLQPGPALRRRRVKVTKKRTWEILPRIGTGPDDRWTVVGTPIPAQSNPAASHEDGQYSTIAAARDAMLLCVATDDGTHEES